MTFDVLNSHLDQLRTWVDPRLMSKSVYDFPGKFGVEPHTSIRSRFQNMKTKDLLKDIDAAGVVAIVTGANSGLGNYKRKYLFTGTSPNRPGSNVTNLLLRLSCVSMKVVVKTLKEIY